MSSGPRFHVLSNEACPYCQILKGAMMCRFGITELEQLDRYVKFYENERDVHVFMTEYGHVKGNYSYIPAIVEVRDGKPTFIKGLSEYLRLYCGKSQKRSRQSQ